MAPKRVTSKAPAAAVAPAAEIQRRGRKRRTSDASSDMEPSQPLASQESKTKRQRRQIKTITEEVEPSQVDAGVPAVDCAAPADEATGDNIILSEHTIKHVHFSESQEPVIEIEKVTATNITPHPHKVAVDRRSTLSPTRHIITKTQRTARHSLPPTLSISGDAAAVTVQELQFSPLRAVLDDRIRRRLRRSHLSEEINAIEEHEREDRRTSRDLQELRDELSQKDLRMKELELELESQRQLGIDISEETDADRRQRQAVEEELEILKKEIAMKMEHGAHADHGYDIEMADDNFMVVNSHEDSVNYPRLPAQVTRSTITTTTVTTEPGSQIASLSSPGRSFEAERQQFEQAIVDLTHEASNAKAALQILVIELQSLGFSDGEEVDTETILQSIRDSFARIRATMEIVGAPVGDVSNSKLLDLVIQQIHTLSTRTTTYDTIISEKNNLNQTLIAQVDGLLDRLADNEIRKSTLEQRWKELDQSGDEQERTIVELEAQLEANQQERDALDEMLQARDQRIAGLEIENATQASSIDKLGAALQGYRDEVTRLEGIITKMEADHRDAIEKIDQATQQTLAAYEHRLNAERTKREILEVDNDGKQSHISALEVKLELAESTLDMLRTQLSGLQKRADAEQAQRETAERELDDKLTWITTLESKIERAEADLEKLHAQLEQLRANADAERRQREVTEADLDERNITIEGLTEKLHAAGIDANNLRQKLFEQQMVRSKAIIDLEDAAAQREHEFQTDIEEEIGRREEAERIAAARGLTIEQLTQQLVSTENRVALLLLERDEAIVTRDTQLAEAKREIESLNNALQDIQDDLSAYKEQAETRIGELSDQIEDLNNMLSDRATIIAQLQAQNEETEAQLADSTRRKDATIASLGSALDATRAEIKDLQDSQQGLLMQAAALEDEKESLERRVEAEAVAMLELSANKDDQIEALKKDLTDKHKEVLNLGERAKQVDARWKDVLEARNEEVDTLKTVLDARITTITALVRQNADIKARFAAYIRSSDAAVALMREDIANAAASAELRGAELEQEGRKAMEEVEAMDTVSEIRVTTATASSSTRVKENVAVQRLKRGRGRKRNVDSGIGIEGEDANGGGEEGEEIVLA
ncbi:hypothetical protein LTR50_006616 [Elasticomyces elasticus]|nr:hypothetical protein LTR50_006616 [Elasticomyces elasticus]